jgi:cytochrome oxidase Cu insertion factor (SCO1/SenC/PrrC family)
MRRVGMWAAALLVAWPALAAADKPKYYKFDVGTKAPEIEGSDVDGKKFKLSDYRGKVVVLDFWGNW